MVSGISDYCNADERGYVLSSEVSVNSVSLHKALLFTTSFESSGCSASAVDSDNTDTDLLNNRFMTLCLYIFSLFRGITALYIIYHINHI